MLQFSCYNFLVIKKKSKITPLGKFAEAATRGVLQKNVFLEISKISQENTCTRVSEMELY